MGQLVQSISTKAHPVRRALTPWRVVPVALGTAAVLAGCGAGGHPAPRAAVSSAHARPASSHHARKVAAATAHAHPATQPPCAEGCGCDSARASGEQPPGAEGCGCDGASAPCERPHDVCQSRRRAGVLRCRAGQCGSGCRGTNRRWICGGPRQPSAWCEDQDHHWHAQCDDRHLGRGHVGIPGLDRVRGPDSDLHVAGEPAVEQPCTQRQDHVGRRPVLRSARRLSWAMDTPAARGGVSAMNTPTVVYMSGPSAHGVPVQGPAPSQAGQAPHPR